MLGQNSAEDKNDSKAGAGILTFYEKRETENNNGSEINEMEPCQQIMRNTGVKKRINNTLIPYLTVIYTLIMSGSVFQYAYMKTLDAINTLAAVGFSASMSYIMVQRLLG